MLNFLIGTLVGGTLGGTLGVIIMSACVVAGRCDRQMEQEMFKEDK